MNWRGPCINARPQPRLHARRVSGDIVLNLDVANGLTLFSAILDDVVIDVGSFGPESADNSHNLQSAVLHTVLVDLGNFDNPAENSHNLQSAELDTVVIDVGSFGPESANNSHNLQSAVLDTVVIDTGTTTFSGTNETSLQSATLA